MLDKPLNICYNKITKNKESRKAHTMKGKVNTMTKMTYVKALEIAINGMADGEAKDKLIALKAQVEKKNSAERKPTKAQVENAALKDNAMTATEIADAFGISNQKASALLTAMVTDEVVTREVIKRKAYFKVA